MQHKGWIALDIDGTVTHDIHAIPSNVVRYLHSLVLQGWGLIFITGRTFSFAHSSLKSCDFPYFLAVQNGADILAMPAVKLLSRTYLEPDVIVHLENAYRGRAEDFIVYAGYEKGDFCYYRPSRFSPLFLEYLEKVKALAPEPWQAVTQFNFDPKLRFPLVKCFGTKEEMQEIFALLNPLASMHVTLIQDRVGENLYLNLVTAPFATKGHALERILEGSRGSCPLIVAGDDLNDSTMLQLADISIVMETAPHEMLQEADIIAPSAEKEGIIDALEEALRSL